MQGIEPNQIYETALKDFRDYTETDQDLPDLKVIKGSVLEGDPEFFSSAEVYHGQEEDLGEDRIQELVYEHSENRDIIRVDELEDQGRKVIEHYGEVREEEPIVDLFSIGMPEGYEHIVDRENYQIVLGEEDLRSYNVETAQNLMLGGIKLHAERALEESFQPVKQRILDQYSSHNPEINISGFYFNGFGEGGGYGFGDQRLSLGTDFIDQIDIESGETKESDVESTMYHEGIHAMQANTNSMFDNYLDGLKKRSRMADSVDEVIGLPRAFIEAATTFESAREYGGFEGERERVTGVRKAWEEGPESLREFADNNQDKMLDNEYVFGQWVASVINHDMRQVSDSPLEDTRDWLINGVTPVNGMAGTARKAFEDMNLEPPEVLDRYDSFDDRVPEEERRDPDDAII